MFIYTVEDAEGNQYDIEGPEGATPEQLQSVVAGGGAVAAPQAPKKSFGEYTKGIWDRRLEEAQGVRPGLDPENEFGTSHFIGDTGIPNPLRTVRDIADLGARGLEYLGAGANTGLEMLDDAAIKTGLADLPSVVGIDQKLLPGSMLGALGEAFPAGLDSVGIQGLAPSMSAKGRATHAGS
jgi:hypothetical protein